MDNLDQALLFLTILVPLGGAGLIMFMPSQRPKDVWYFAIFVSAIALVLSMLVFARYDYSVGGYQFLRTYEWLDAPLNIDFSLGVNGISAPLILLNGIVLFGGVLISQTIKHRPRTSSCSYWPWPPASSVYLPFATCSSSSSFTNWRCFRCTS